MYTNMYHKLSFFVCWLVKFSVYKIIKSHIFFIFLKVKLMQNVVIQFYNILFKLSLYCNFCITIREKQ